MARVCHTHTHRTTESRAATEVADAFLPMSTSRLDVLKPAFKNKAGLSLV